MWCRWAPKKKWCCPVDHCHRRHHCRCWLASPSSPSTANSWWEHSIIFAILFLCSSLHIMCHRWRLVDLP
jgi:hypothetical protein